MLNAHLRFGWLGFVKITEKKTTNLRVRLDRLIAEPPVNSNSVTKAYLLSVIAGDSQIAAISAALSEAAHFTIEAPELPPLRIWLAEKKPQSYRGSIQLPGRKRPIRHLIAASEELISATEPTKLVLPDSDPAFVWSSVAKMLGLPGLPEWADWFHEQLTWRNACISLLGIGCAPVRINATREEILSWLGDGVSSGALKFPDENRAVRWPSFDLKSIFHPAVFAEPESLSHQSSALMQ